MRIKIVHLSDIHYKNGWIENLGIVLQELLSDLKEQMKEGGEYYIALSGDVVLAGEDQSLYKKFIDDVGERFNRIGISRDRIICVPGNHDISLKWISENNICHKKALGDYFEEEFNDYVLSDGSILHNKFDNYKEFERAFSGVGVGDGCMTGKGWSLQEGVDVYCLNTAISSCGESSKDKGNLHVDTRSLMSWVMGAEGKHKILIMHHPFSWLSESSKEALENIAQKYFSLSLSGHEHKQGYYELMGPVGSLVSCAAPALFTSKKENLGYSIIDFCSENGVVAITYRQWSQHNTFVSGTAFSNTDDGKVLISKQISSGDDAFVKKYLEKRLSRTLKSYPEQPEVWVAPKLFLEDEKNSGERFSDEKDQEFILASDVIGGKENIIISSPGQFGMSSLANWLCITAWDLNETWIIVDCDQVRPHEAQGVILDELELMGKRVENIDCIVLDSWSSLEKEKVKTLNKILKLFPEVRVVLMRKEEDSFFSDDRFELDVEFEYKIYYLHSLSRSDIRELVSQYNNSRYIGENDAVVEKVASDLAALNLHRTPLNCITLLKVSEVEFDDSPVNRTEVIKRVLFLLFNSESLPKYMSSPDLKDCEHVLGWFCEGILRGGKVSFLKTDFLSSLHKFCEESIIDLEIDALFAMLCSSNILVKRGHFYAFKHRYWIMYFAAQRMHHNEDFKNFIFADMAYANYPELIEFYTGIDRRRNDALDTLLCDLTKIYETITHKVGLPEASQLYDIAKWNPSEEVVESIRTELNDEVQQSNLPDFIKDKYADRGYDPSVPYDQDIANVLEDYSLRLLAHSINACSRALRNSDYADPEKKKDLLEKIMECWDFVTKILLILSPVLAEKGSAEFEGTRFIVVGPARDMEDPIDRFYALFSAIPENISSWFTEDLYSQKMAPLFYNYMESSSSELSKHYVAKILVERRPRNWKSKLVKYISDLHKNSYYLFSIQKTLYLTYKYGFSPAPACEDMIYLRKMVFAKHQTGAKKPNNKLINKVKL